MRQLPTKLFNLSSKLNLLKPHLLLLLSLLLSIQIAEAQQLAFPTAEGYGRFATGGRGGKVLYVTNLNDSGSGSFRAALEASGVRTVVFSVSGTITLQSPVTVRNGSLTIAGQTSPNGITIRKSPVYIAASNVIIRYMRFRLGDEAGKKGYDALSITGQSRDVSRVIVDHCSVSWAKDECVSIIGTPSQPANPPHHSISDVTLQWSIVSEGLSNHAFGGFIKYQASNISVVKNLFAHNTQRNPNINGANGSVTNNVIYNWGGRGVTVDDVAKLNIIGNYAKTGPNSKSEQGYMVIGGQGGTPVNNQLYVEGNYHSQRRTNVNDNNEWAVFDSDASESKHRKNTIHNFSEGIKVLNARDAYDLVLSKGGASVFRDAVDTRVINDAKNGTGKNNISSQAAVGGWPSIAMGTPYPDKDKDGMDDNWENAVGLDPNNDNDKNGDRNGDGYTNLEEFLNCSVLNDCEGTTPVNLPPSISDITDQTIDENTTLGPLSFTIGDSETSADLLIVTATSDNNALVDNSNITIGGTGTKRSITVSPKSNQKGTTNITVTVSDGEKQSSTAFKLAVNEVVVVNTPPTISSVNDQSIEENTSTAALSFTIGDAESSPEALTVTASSGNKTLVADNGMTLGGSGAKRTIAITPVNNQTGTAKITITVSDGEKQTSSSFVLTVTEVVSVNTPPTVSNVDDQSMEENTSSAALPFTIGDAESNPDALIVTASSGNKTLVANSGITLGGSGAKRTIAVAPVNNQTGTSKITITVSDGEKQTSSSFVVTVTEVVSVNTPPTVSNVDDQSMEENTSSAALPFTIGDAESNPDALIVTASSGNKTLVANSGITLGGSGAKRTIAVAPVNNQTGTSKITITVSDGEKQTSSSFVVTVTEVVSVNTPPTVSNIDDLSMEENTSSAALPFTIGDTESSPDKLTVTASSGNQSLVVNNGIALGGTGTKRTIVVSPQSDKTGIAKITITVSDGDKQATESFMVTVNTVIDENTAPTISNLPNQVISANQRLGPLYFKIRDKETSAEKLLLRIKSDNQKLVSNDRIFVRGRGENKALVIYPRRQAVGSCNITIEVDDKSSKVTRESFRLDVSQMGGIPDILKSKLKIYPNPFNDYIKIKTKEIKKGVELAIFDSRGRVRKRGRIRRSRSSRSSLELDVSFLESGVYYLKIKYDGVRATSILMKESF